MPYVNPNLKEHVAALVARLPGDVEPTFQGTCFFGQISNSTGKAFDYLITAKHVYDALQRGGKAWLRVNKGRPGQYNLGTQDLPLPMKGWLFHEDPKVDLAALSLGYDVPTPDPNEDVVRFLKVYLDRMIDNRPPKMMWPPGEGEDVLFIGMTSQFEGVQSNLPLVRKGNMALVTDEPIKGKYGYSQYYVVQAQVYPGNSGSPIWLLHQGRGLVHLGVLVFSYPTDEEVRQAAKGEIELRRNYSLALVVPIEKVLEVINQKDEVARREAQRGPHLPGEAVSAIADDEAFTKQDFGEALRKVSRPDGKEVIEKLDQASS